MNTKMTNMGLPSRCVRVSAFGAPSVLKEIAERVVTLPSPLIEQDVQQVHIAVKAFGINPSETYQRAGAYAVLPPLPYTPGRDSAGVVLDVTGGGGGGASSTSCASTSTDASCTTKSASDTAPTSILQPGTRVFTTDSLNGCYAEETIAPASAVFPLPANLSFAQGAGFGVAYYAAWRAFVEKGRGMDHVAKTSVGKELSSSSSSVPSAPAGGLLVHGASGGVGILILQMAKRAGLKPVVATASSERGRRLLRKMFLEDGESFGNKPDVENTKFVFPKGDFFVTGHQLQREEGSQDELKQGLPQDHKFSIIIEMQGQHNLHWDMQNVAREGRIVMVGNKGHSEVSVNPRLLMQTEAVVTGFVGTQPENRKLADQALREEWVNWLEPVVDEELRFDGLEAAAEAHEEILTRKNGTAGRIVVDLTAAGEKSHIT
ncbi:unnamed protein product [Amoebophrya sp. A25]|nr:unnamed protein product [Amoebophrya sp. A25]|eukprot:GSA25T00009231001.1